MDILQILTFIGGLSMFLYGMNVMGAGLQKLAGGRLEKILEKLTTNRWRGMLLGLGITAVIQSSGATTVMVVGYVNSGLMKLSQATGVIMGANIGTTVTAWILAMSDIRGDLWALKLLQPEYFSPILAAAGVIMTMAGKKQSRRDVGTILLGFAVLMFGMNTMSGSLSSFKDDPQFSQILLKFSNPLLGLLAGTVMTAIVQSSSASVGILQAVSSTGAVTCACAVPVILGLHTAMKVVNTVVLLPLSKWLEHLAALTIPDRQGKKEKIQLLDQRFLATPAFAVEQSKRLTDEMARLSCENIVNAMQQVRHYDAKIAAKTEENEQKWDHYEDKLGTYLVQLSAQSMTIHDSREVSMLLHAIGDIERISDHAVNILHTAQEIEEKHIEFSAEANNELEIMSRAVCEIVSLATEAFCRYDIEMAAKVEPLEQVVDLLKAQLKARHIERLQRGDCTTVTGFVFSDLITNFERVADQCSNIAVCMIQISKDNFDTHKYLNTLKNSDDESFKRLYEEYRSKYALD